MEENQMNVNEIATVIFSSGGRSRDCEVRSKLKTNYNESFAEKVIEQLAKIEIDHSL